MLLDIISTIEEHAMTTNLNYMGVNVDNTQFKAPEDIGP
jgi:hypothetical protein